MSYERLIKIAFFYQSQKQPILTCFSFLRLPVFGLSFISLVIECPLVLDDCLC